MSNIKSDHDPALLGDLEKEVLQFIWSQGPLSADAIREQLARPLKDSTVRTVLSRLEEKGYLRHKVDNRAYIYEAAEAPRRVAARAVRQIVDWICNGSVEELLVGMVDTKTIGESELKKLRKKIANAKKGRK